MCSDVVVFRKDDLSLLNPVITSRHIFQAVFTATERGAGPRGKRQVNIQILEKHFYLPSNIYTLTLHYICLFSGL